MFMIFRTLRLDKSQLLHNKKKIQEKFHATGIPMTNLILKINSKVNDSWNTHRFESENLDIKKKNVVVLREQM